MGVDSYLLGNAGPGHVIEHDGRTYRISLIDQRAKAEWEERLFRRAVKAAEILAPARPADWHEAKLAQLDDEFMAGDFALISEKSVKVLKTLGGVQLLLEILTGLDPAALAPVLKAKHKEVKALIHLVIRESFPGVKIPDADPNE